MSKTHIIGGGIIGLCSAWYLNKAGADVTVVDQSNLLSGTSHGNAGMIVPSHFVPLASPGVIAQGMRWMFDAKSPFYVKPRLDKALLQWLWKFYRSCNHAHVARCAPVLLEFNEWSRSLYEEFSQEEGFDFAFEKKGLLMLYQTARQEKEEIELAERAHELGVAAKVVGETDLKKLEPSIKINARGGVYFQGDAHLKPGKFINDLISALRQVGVQFILGKEIQQFETTGNRITGIEVASQKIATEHVVIAAGSWTSKLLRKLGHSLSLQPGKGYSVTIEDPKASPAIPTILTEAKVAVTPMGNNLRVGGTLELGQWSDKINRLRVRGILESMPRYYPEIALDDFSREEVWQGYRPCAPDGMPYIDTGKMYSNLTIATGHGMMGMSLGPATGKLVSELVSGEKLNLDISSMSIGR